MTNHLPLMLGVVAPVTCSRVGCNEPATRHIMWTVDLENGIACDEHMAEARRHYVFYAEHEYDASYCSHPHAGYSDEQNACLIPIDEIDWDAHAAAELAAPRTAAPR